MSELKDPRIKLFGKTIELPETSAVAAGIGEAAQCCEAAGEDSLSQDPPCSSNSNIPEDSDFNGDAEDEESHKIESCPNQDYAKAEEIKDQPLTSSEESKDSNNQSPPLVAESKTDEDQSETDNAQEKTLKKPDKILPCPRCNSMDTKFCYFNNYNVNQPRHFCKNCQRYWTAGGTMRNVPVGAGRRKNKNTPPQSRHLTFPSNGAHQPNGTLLIFNSDLPLCDSMVSALNIADKNGSRNGAHDPVSNGDDGCGPSSPHGETGQPRLSDPGQKYHPFLPSCFPGAPWPYPFHFGPARFPLPFYSTPPPPYLSPVALQGSWNVPCFYPSTGPMSQALPDPGPTSPTLGKHSRDETPKPASPEEGKQNVGNLWVPKTLRIDDPRNTAKSSIWAMLGIKNERTDSIGGGGLVRALQSRSKGEERMMDLETSTILQANPAALSRSIQFHESM